jgi:hypothetical protein
VRRPALALWLLPLLAAGCSESAERYPCPGVPVVTLAFRATRTAVACVAGGPVAGVNSLYPAEVDFTGTIAYSASSSGAALCLARSRAEPLVGAQVADQLDVSLDTRGALLAACNTACAVFAHQQVIGTVSRDAGGAPTGFTGTLLDQATLDSTVAGASCSPCTTPCQASYALTGLP